MIDWHGFQMTIFEFEGHEAILVFPEKSDINKNWALKTEYWDAFPETEIELLKKGLHIAYLKNETRFATKSDCDRKKRFADFLSKRYGLADKCTLVGMSCGGAHAVNFAGFYPEKINCLFIDAPVLTFNSYPGKFGNEECETVWENEFIYAYPGIKRADLFNFDNHPISKVNILIENKISVIMLYGTEDKTVIYEENGKLLEDAYKDNMDLLTVIPRNMQGHHPHGLMNKSNELAEMIIEIVNRK